MLRFHFFTAKQGTWVHKDDRGPYEGRAEEDPLPLLPPYLPSRPCLPSRSGAPFARATISIFPPYIFSQFFFPLLHPAPLLPPPFPSSPLPLTLSAPQLSDTSVLQEVKCDIIKTRLPLF